MLHPCKAKCFAALRPHGAVHSAPTCNRLGLLCSGPRRQDVQVFGRVQQVECNRSTHRWCVCVCVCVGWEGVASHRQLDPVQVDRQHFGQLDKLVDLTQCKGTGRATHTTLRQSFNIALQPLANWLIHWCWR